VGYLIHHKIESGEKLYQLINEKKMKKSFQIKVKGNAINDKMKSYKYNYYQQIKFHQITFRANKDCTLLHYLSSIYV